MSLRVVVTSSVSLAIETVCSACHKIESQIVRRHVVIQDVGKSNLNRSHARSLMTTKRECAGAAQRCVIVTQSFGITVRSVKEYNA